MMMRKTTQIATTTPNSSVSNFVHGTYHTIPPLALSTRRQSKPTRVTQSSLSWRIAA